MVVLSCKNFLFCFSLFDACFYVILYYSTASKSVSSWLFLSHYCFIVGVISTRIGELNDDDIARECGPTDKQINKK